MELVDIQAGKLHLQISKGESRLDQLLDFASRENQKRGFLFISKVLGKHVPVKPSVMRAIYQELAELCGTGCSTYVVGMAETATGLGAGIADSLSRLKGQESVIYQHTTRHALDSRVWLTLDESHSHAVNHILYEPTADFLPDILAAKRVILIDDEITTGRTLHLLAEKLLTRLHNVQEVIILSIVSWLDEEKQKAFADLPVKIRWVNLLEGQFTFIPDNNFNACLPPDIDKGICQDKSRDELGRRGLRLPYSEDISIPEALSGQMTVVGTGEHLFLPFLLAEKMEASGCDVLFQSTTRSPILAGSAIKRKMTFSDKGKSVVHFIYNLPTDRHTHIICETEQAYINNGLRHLLAQESRHA